MGVLNTILLVLFVLSGILTVLLVLAHSGKGTGVSDMIAASMYNASAGSGIMEKNLDRLTIITTTIFLVCAIVMALTFPVGAIGSAAACIFELPAETPGFLGIFYLCPAEYAKICCWKYWQKG